MGEARPRAEIGVGGRSEEPDRGSLGCEAHERVGLVVEVHGPEDEAVGEVVDLGVLEQPGRCRCAGDLQVPSTASAAPGSGRCPTGRGLRWRRGRWRRPPDRRSTDRRPRWWCVGSREGRTTSRSCGSNRRCRHRRPLLARRAATCLLLEGQLLLGFGDEGWQRCRALLDPEGADRPGTRWRLDAVVAGCRQHHRQSDGELAVGARQVHRGLGGGAAGPEPGDGTIDRTRRQGPEVRGVHPGDAHRFGWAAVLGHASRQRAQHPAVDVHHGPGVVDPDLVVAR